MPTDPESLIIYAIVLLTGAWLSRGLWKRGSKAKGRPCGNDCCGSTARHPAIQKILDRKRK